MKIKHLKTLTKAEYFHGGALPCVVRVMKAAPSNDTVALHGHEFPELVLLASVEERNESALTSFPD